LAPETVGHRTLSKIINGLRYPTASKSGLNITRFTNLKMLTCHDFFALRQTDPVF
jgi:hypothetical protein